MMIDEFRLKRKVEELGEDKEIKVKIPLDYHIKLHTVKVVKGQNISDTVKAALAYYFADLAGATARPATPVTVDEAAVEVPAPGIATATAPRLPR